MTETTDRAALIAEAAEYDSDSAWCGNLIQDLAAALADAEREIAEQAAVIEAAKDLFSTQRRFSADALAMYNALYYPRSITDA